MASTSKVDVWNRALGRIGESLRLEDENDDRPAAETCARHYDDILREVFEARPWPWAMRQTVLTDISEQIDSHAGTGAQLEFGISAPFLSTSQVTVEVIDSGGTATEQEAGTDYSVTQADPEQAIEASLAMVVAPAVGETLRITVTTERVGWTNLYALPADCVTPVAILSQGVRLDLLQEKSKEEHDKLINDGGTGYMLACNVDEVEAFEYVTLITSVGTWPAMFLDAVVWRLAAELALEIKKEPQLAAQMMQAYMASQATAFAMSSNARQNTQKPTSPIVAARG